MAIHEPGRVLMKHVPLAFVQKKVHGTGNRSTNANLSLTSMIDFLIVTVIFLLMSFSASGETPMTPGLTLPKATNTDDMLLAPVVSVHKGQIFVDGAPAGKTQGIEETDRPQKIDELFNNLKGKKDLFKRSHPATEKAPDAVILQIDQSVKASVVKSVFQTCAVAGFPNVNFMVDKLAGEGQ